MPVKVRDALTELKADGWEEVLPRKAGSHRQFKHATKRGPVTIVGSPGDEIAAGTLASIRKQAGLPRLGRK